MCQSLTKSLQRQMKPGIHNNMVTDVSLAAKTFPIHAIIAGANKLASRHRRLVPSSTRGLTRCGREASHRVFREALGWRPILSRHCCVST